MDPALGRFRYEFMRLDDIRAMLARCPVAVQPSGLLEWHGEHNAIGLDGLKAQYICGRAVQLLGDGALMPVNWVGTYGYTRFPGTVCFDEQVTLDVFRQLFLEQVKVGFKVIFLLTGHYGEHQMRALREARDAAIDALPGGGAGVRIVAMRDPDLVPGIYGGDHARRYETSMLMRIGQAWGVDLVDLSGFKTGEIVVPRYAVEIGIPAREPEPWVWDQDLRDPAVCSLEFGEFLIARKASAMAHEVIELLHELGIDYEPPAPLPEFT